MDAILERLTPALRDVCTARELWLFGSRAAGTHDEMSDLDLDVLVDDMALAAPACLRIVEDVIGVECAFTFRTSGAWSLILRGESPMHRIDIGVGDESVWRERELKIPRMLLWHQTPPVAQFAGEPTFPVTRDGTTAHFVFDLLIGALRSVKERRRGNEGRARRRAEAVVRGVERLNPVTDIRAAAESGGWDHTVVASAAEALLDAGVRDAAQRGEECPVAPAQRLVDFLASA
jgi:hypothetical protein